MLLSVALPTAELSRVAESPERDGCLLAMRHLAMSFRSHDRAGRDFSPLPFLRSARTVPQMAERFYLNLPLTPGPVELTGPEAHHLAQVCRLRPGDPVCLFNGDGHEYPGQVQTVQRRAVLIDIESVRSPQRELPFLLEVAAPLPKGDRAQFLIEKLTELGVATFIPLKCERSVVHPREGKLEKLERYVIEASKQCGRNVLMRIEPLTPFIELLERRKEGDIAWLAHPAGAPLSLPTFNKPSAVRVAVGPEGGWTEGEAELARENGWAMISLGKRILRIETAATALAVIVGAGL